jgi:hypothetical protein
MKKLTKREKIDLLKEEIIESDCDRIVNSNRHGKTVGTMYIKEKMDYGFHIYYIHEPDASNPLAGVNGTITEMYYNLRHQKYYIKRNMSDVQFSVRNIDTMFLGNTEKIFDFLSTNNNQGLYASAYSYLGRMGEEKSKMFGRFFHRLITEHSYYELLYKAGVPIRKGINIVNKEGTSPKEILGLSRTQWKMMVKYDISIDNLQNRRSAEGDNKAINLLDYITRLENEFGIDKKFEFINNEFGYIYRGSHWRSAIHTATTYNLPLNKLIRYIYFECDVSQGLNSGMAIQQYTDYIRMTTEMGYERFDRYPKFLRTAHDIASRNYKVKLNENEMKEWSKNIEKDKEYQSKIGDYKIILPDKPEDLVREGNMLGHCVGSYVSKVRKGLSTILFLREVVDEEHPLVTIEVRDKRIVQEKGKMNNKPSSREIDAIRKFASKFELSVGGF